MPDNHPPTSQKPRLNDLLAMIGVTREQLTEMTAEDLFAAATQWQDAVLPPDVEVERFSLLDDRLFETLQDHLARPGMLN